MGMFDNDIVFGGEQLEPSVTLGDEYVLWECGIVAKNVVTSLGTDGTKAELVISQVQGHARDGVPTCTVPAKFGTFASSIVDKVQRRGEGDLPAVVTFGKVDAKASGHNQAFVMTFVRPWDDPVPPAPIPALSKFVDAGGAATAAPQETSVKTDKNGEYVVVGGKKVYKDPKTESGADHPL